MVAENRPARVGRRWYQRTWLWVVVAFAAIPLTVVWFILGAVLDVNNVIFGLLGLMILVLIPMGLWMSALVAQRGWARGILSIAAVILLFLSAWAVWNYVKSVEAGAQAGCEIMTTANGETVQVDPELCASADDGSIEALQRTAWIMFAVFWVAPLFVLYFLRRRFRPDDVATGGTHVAEAAGWVLVTLGGLFLVLILFTADITNSITDTLLSIALYVGVPTVSGILLVRWGRRRHAPTADQIASE